jgi:predicted nucleic acid-binding protein
VTTFLDTDVLIDCLRGMPAAQSWLTRAADETFQVPGIVAMELLDSFQNKG